MSTSRCGFYYGSILALVWIVACTQGERADQDGVLRTTKRVRQLKFKPDDFEFVKLQVREGERDGLLGTCIHVTMRDANQKTWDCDIGVTLPIYVRDEQWPRDEEDGQRYVARAANAMRTNLLTFEHADGFTCRAYYNQIRAYLRDGTKRQRETWKGANTMRCAAYQGATLPDFYIQRGHLLIGEYREWGKHVPAP